MRYNWKKFWNNPWTVTIGGGLVLSVIISVLNDLINRERVFSTISTVFKKVVNIVGMFLNFNIKVWWLLLGVVILSFLLVLYIKYLDYMPSKKNTPIFLEYMQDEILDYLWRWTWKKDIYGKYYIDDLCPICSQCETPIVDNLHGYGGRYKCLRCNKAYTKPLPEFDNVKMLISDNVRRKYF